MEYILFSNQAFKYQSGSLIGLTDTGERKLVLNIFNDEHCSLFVYNMYTIPHDILRGIKQAKILVKKNNYMEIQGYGLSSNGIPIDNLRAKICFENNQIISVEYIRLDNDFSLLHKKRVERSSSFFLKLFNLDVDNYSIDLSELITTMKLFSMDVDNINNYNNAVEPSAGVDLSASCDYLSKIRENNFVKNDDKLHLLVCLLNFYLQYKSINVNTSYNYNVERIKMIRLLNKNVEPIIFLIANLLLKNQNSKVIPFVSDSEHVRRIKIFWLLESYYLFIEGNHDYSRYGNFGAFDELIQHNKSKFYEGFFYPYNIESAKDITKKIFDLMCDNIIDIFREAL
jgi:hypothetical protein